MTWFPSFQRVIADWSTESLIHMGLFPPTLRELLPYYHRKEVYRK